MFGTETIDSEGAVRPGRPSGVCNRTEKERRGGKEPPETNMKDMKDMEVIFSALRLSRAMRRCPPDFGERPFPPAVGRMLACVRVNPGVSSRELCELLDLRPSSLSEMLSRAEENEWLTRTPDEEDKRVQHISLTEKGILRMTGLEAAREADAARKTACFTEAEKEQFAALCNRLSDHLEKLSLDLPDFPEGGPEGPRCPRQGRPHHGPKGPGMPEEDPEGEERRPGPWLPPGARLRS